VRTITAEKYFLEPLSNTFHGRDLFAPTAAHLAAGAAFSSLGPLITDHLNSRDAVVRTGKRFWTGRVLTIDRFGNLITNFTLAEFPALAQRPFEFAVGPERVTKLVRTFADCAPGELVVIEGSSEYLEIVSNQGSAAKMLGYGTGAPIELTIW
jgi:S-adenosyl-L-methionine hydrolase (adenosine-forming)